MKKEEEYEFTQAKSGQVVKTSSGKTRITIRLDTDILNWFRQQVHKMGGGNYQTHINEALREYVQQNNGMLENTLRKIIREEFKMIKSKGY